jgi:hypothetical protein
MIASRIWYSRYLRVKYADTRAVRWYQRIHNKASLRLELEPLGEREAAKLEAMHQGGVDITEVSMLQ